MAAPQGSALLAAIFNGDEEIVRMLRAAFEREGYRTVAGRLADIQSGDLDFIAFLEEHDPDVLVIDIPRPYERHLNVVRLIRAADSNPQRCCIVTTVQKDPLECLIAPLKWACPIIGQPFGPDDVLRAVREARTEPSPRGLT